VAAGIVMSLAGGQSRGKHLQRGSSTKMIDDAFQASLSPRETENAARFIGHTHAHPSLSGASWAIAWGWYFDS